MDWSTIDVLIVLASDARRGAEIEGQRLGTELAARGASAEVVALAPAAEQYARLEVDTLGTHPLAPRTLLELRRRAHRHRTVIAYGSTSLPACAVSLALSSRPFVYRSIGDPAHWARGSLHRARTGIMLRRAAKVVALWDESARSIERMYGVSSPRIGVIPNARSVAEFAPPTEAERSVARESFGAGAETTVTVVVSALTSEKRIDLVIDAVADLPEVLLVVAGDGPERASLRALASRRLGERVVFAGALGDVRPVLAAADVLALPSLTEGMPGVVIEAAFMDVAVAACSVGAIDWLMARGVRGVTTPVDSTPAAFGRAIRQAAAAPGVVGNLRTDCSWERVLDQWAAVLRSL